LSPAAIVKAPRISIPSSGPSIWVEDSFPASLLVDLKSRGEMLDPATYKDTSGVQMVARDGARFLAASDPRKFGFAEIQ
jgi:gamma-glutamyltranspeptidase